MVTTLEQLVGLMREYGATRLYAKELAANDNSKNQVYLGGGFGALNIIPHGEIYVDREERAGSKQDRPKASVEFYWIDEGGRHLAPGANLILYPDYPEVRMSGFLRGCRPAPSDLMNQRLDGRVMFFGVTPDGRVLGYVVPDGHPLGNELKAGQRQRLGVFLELSALLGRDPKSALLAELRRIYEMGWIAGQRLRGGVKVPYSAPNAGGYTLEAELGISPNGNAEPDFMGWEVKQYGVTNFQRFTPKSPVTLMTPEPTAGVYRAEGVEAFVRRFGYPDTRGRLGRLNFGGIYRYGGAPHARTMCSVFVEGFDPATGKIADIDGGIYLRHAAGDDAAVWSIRGMMEHWNRKHAQAVYVPSICENPPRRYQFGHPVLLCEQTDFILFLKAFVAGKVYYDPGIKLVEEAGAEEIKRRSQFRIKHAHLTDLYHSHQVVDVRTA